MAWSPRASGVDAPRPIGCEQLDDARGRGEARIALSPHIGGVTADACVKMGVAAARNALAVLDR